MRLYHSHLAIGVLQGDYDLAPGARATLRTWMLQARDRVEASPSYNTEKITKDLVSHRTADQLSLYHDSQFSAFSTEVFDWMNQKHNRSSSPFTTLAEQAERKVVTTGAGQPNY